MRILGIILFTAMLAACAAKKQQPQETMVVHTGDCSASKQTINCQWQDVPANNMH
ncbi:hypothetical protein [Tatumella morbirosei]|uniref:hypothetical protein n=1 Tax=Tatumella morbirosei TaxID=642227 RepID=UPI000A80277D|nr:hypothetical protein [Tatumella morbirosei]